MKTITTKFIFAIVILIISKFNVLSQEKKIYTGEMPVQIVKDDFRQKKAQRQNTITPEMIEIEKQMKTAKQSGDKNSIINLQKKYDAVGGTVTETPEKINMYRINPEEIDLDDIYLNNIFSTNDQYSIVDMATATDHRGTNTGRIWTVWIAEEDFKVQFASTFGLAYSDDHGLSWTVQYLFAMDMNDYMATLDIELIEDNANNNYMWIVFNPNVLAIVNLNTGASNAFSLTWNSGIYTGGALHPRIVSDNAYYPDIPFVYIIAQHWKIPDPNYNEYEVGEATAKCVSPFTITPNISYGNYYVNYPDSYLFGIPDYTTDVAYFRNGASDSIVVLINNTSSKMDIYTHSIFSFNGNSDPNYIGNLNPQNNIIPEQRAYIATNGGYNKIMIVFKRQYDFNDWDIAYYKSTNGSAGWLQGYIDFSSLNAYGDARIIGERNNQGKFHVAYMRELNSQISYGSSISYNWSSPVFPYSNLKNLSSTDPYSEHKGNPAPGYSTLFSEPCTAVWLDSTGKNIKSSAGCSGPFSQQTKKLFLFGAIQGHYDPVSDTEIPDTIKVYLRNYNSPYAIIDSTKNILLGPGTGQYFMFGNAVNGTSYYAVVKHRNALETWSADPVTFVNDETSIAYSVSSIYAYGNNEIQVDNSPYDVFAFYSGDANQDGTVDVSDIIDVYNDATNGVSGYVNTDANGDDFVDVSDLILTFNNANNIVSVIRP